MYKVSAIYSNPFHNTYYIAVENKNFNLKVKRLFLQCASWAFTKVHRESRFFVIEEIAVFHTTWQEY